MYQLFQIGLSASTIASSFGKTISENKEPSDYRPEDISLSLLRMISYNIGQVSFLELNYYQCNLSTTFLMGKRNVTERESSSSKSYPIYLV